MRKRIWQMLFKRKVKKLMKQKKNKKVVCLEKYDPYYNPEYIDKNL